MAKCDEFLYPFALKGNPSFALNDSDVSVSSADVQFFHHDQGSQDSALDPLSDDPMLVLSVLEPVLVEPPEPGCRGTTPQKEKPKKRSTTTKAPSSFVCSFPGCHKEFTRSNYLKIHLRIHTNEKDNVCPFADCGRAFTTRYALRVHERTHTGERPYKCFICEKTFRTSNDRNVHERSHTDVRPYSCELCPLSFKTLKHMKSHMKSVHEKSRDHGCDVCGKRFSNSWNLASHKNIHNNVKRYVCPVAECSKAFTDYSSLFKHRFVHSVGVLLHCQVCDKAFETKFELMNHKKLCELQACEKLCVLSTDKDGDQTMAAYL